MKIFWFIPTFGDGRYLGSSKGSRATNHSYLRQIAEAVDELGYYGALLPTGRSCDDAWIVASSLFPLTRRMRFLVAVRPGLMSPTLTARMVASFDRLSQGRLLINVVTGGDPVELAGDGLFLEHDERYRLTDEFLTIFRKVVAEEEIDFKGKVHTESKDRRNMKPVAISKFAVKLPLVTVVLKETILRSLDPSLVEAQGALSAAKHFAPARAQAWLNSGVHELAEDPYILRHFGEFWVELEAARPAGKSRRRIAASCLGFR